jgi:UDP-glucose 4-epimerase
MPKLLITGISGGQGRLLASRVADSWEVVGVDSVPWEGRPKSVTVHTVDLLKKRFQEVFRAERPEAVVHLAFIRHFRSDPLRRHAVNVLGTRRVLELAARHGTKQVVIVSSSYVYGALPENPQFLDEDAPLNASRTYPEIRDLAEMDTLAVAYLWRHPEIAIAVLRPVSTLGPHVHSAIVTYLRLGWVPTILGFDPMFQFIHEEDVTEAIARVLEKRLRGVFNIAGPGQVPLSVAIRETGNTPVPLPESLARAVFGRLFRLGLFQFPPGAIDFVKYPCTVSGRRFVGETGFAPRFDLEETFASIRR